MRYTNTRSGPEPGALNLAAGHETEDHPANHEDDTIKGRAGGRWRWSWGAHAEAAHRARPAHRARAAHLPVPAAHRTLEGQRRHSRILLSPSAYVRTAWR